MDIYPRLCYNENYETYEMKDRHNKKYYGEYI